VRLGAWAVDFVMCYLPSGVLCGFGGYINDELNDFDPFGTTFIVLGVAWFLFITGYTWYLIASRGQTIAKRWFKIKIVRDSGKPVDFVSGVILRNWITSLLSNPLLLSILGCLFFVLDACMIFGRERRCLHDHIASTYVIEVGKGWPPKKKRRRKPIPRPRKKAPAEPTEAPAEPTEAPAEATEAPAEATEAPAAPTEASSGPEPSEGGEGEPSSASGD
jgi:uncharacterized RDD family membrane protein YckC